MRRVPLALAAIALALTVSLTGCGRFAGNSTAPTSALPSPVTDGLETLDNLNDLNDLLDSVGDALNETDGDLTAGNDAAGNADEP